MAAVEAREAIGKEGPDWWVKRHHGFGMGVRNALRLAGFNWGSATLDDIWFVLFEEATKKYFTLKEESKIRNTFQP